MAARKKAERLFWILLLFFGTLLWPAECSLARVFDLEEIRGRRPGAHELVFDATGLLAESDDYVRRYLIGIRDRYAIEIVIASVPERGTFTNVKSLAVDLFEHWDIGRKFSGRGVLLLFIEGEKEVKLEISRELEDVFTDAFSGIAADRQLKPYYLAGNVSIGLVAVLEELEKRAQIKHEGGYTPAVIKRLDDEFLAQGAGVTRQLSAYQPETVSQVGVRYPAGATPDEAWQTIIQSYKDKVRDPDLGVYTELTKLAYADYTNLSDSHYVKEYNKYKDKPYEILEEGDYAVVFFGAQDGWDNAPIMLCRTQAGWQFDIVTQRKYVRMGGNPKWGIERAVYPHMALLWRSPYFEGQDIPLAPEDVYHKDQDAVLAGKIRQLQERVKQDPDDGDVLIELGRLTTIASHGLARIQWLNRAKSLRPEDPRPYKYLAISHVDMYYQYAKAIEELKEYVRREPGDLFGYNFLGYCYLKTGQPAKAVAEFEKALRIDADDLYALCKMAEAQARLYENAWEADLRRPYYKENARNYYQQARALVGEKHLRVYWLTGHLKRQGVL